MKLRRNEYCPIHRSMFCCGRQQARKERRLRLGVQRIEDPHHPRGYRELRSPAEMRKLLNRKSSSRTENAQSVTRNLPTTATSYRTTRHPKGMGGAWRDDHPENIASSPLVVQL